MTKLIDMIGQRFGRLLVIRRNGRSSRCARWDCMCDCGNTKNIDGGELRRGAVRSCGCLHVELTSIREKRHGMSHTPTYRTWVDMIRRCTDPRRNNYADYGGRGICVCERWRVFDNFLEDMRIRPDGYSLDRIDNDKGYNPENCRWATLVQQNNNTRSNRHVIFNGKSVTLAEAARLSGISYIVLKNRVRSNWSNDRLFSPVQTSK